MAKTRLGGLSPVERADLALAFVCDAATAAIACPLVERVVVVTNDARARTALVDLGAVAVPDSPDDGLNAAIRFGVERAEVGRGRVAAMLGDLPALRSEHLTAAFAAGGRLPSWFVSDAEGTGTTLLGAIAGTMLPLAFGPGSRNAHLRLGAKDVSGPGQAGLRRDVDTQQHLVEARRLGVGAFTRAKLDAGAVVRSRSSV